MYPDLSYLLHDLVGSPRDNWLSIFKTFGLFMLLAFIVAARLLRSELRRREALGQLAPRRSSVIPGHTVTTADYISNGIFGFLLGFKVPYAIAELETWKNDPSAVLLSLDGYWWSGLLGAALLVGYYYRIGRRQRELPEPVEVDVYPSDRVGPITLMAAAGGLLGAKLFAIVEYLPRFFEDPLGVLLSGDGLAIYGGLIGGGLAVYWYLRRHGIPKLPVMDAVAPALIVAYGIGRIGCQLSGDGDWGTTVAGIPDGWFLPDWLYGFDYPHNVLNAGNPIPGCVGEHCRQLAELHYPTPVYETLMAFAIGALLWSLRKRLTPVPGLLFCLYLVCNGIERFFIEYVRLNDQYNVLGLQLTQAQLIALGFVLTGTLLGAYFWRQPRFRAARTQVPGVPREPRE